MMAQSTDTPTRIYELSSGLRVAVARLARRLRAEKADDELSDGQIAVLGLLCREGPHTLGALSDHERVTPPSMNRRVNRLVDAGYAQRLPEPDDGRKVLVAATDAGRALIEETRRRRNEWLYVRLEQLPAAQRRTLEEATEIIRKLTDS